MESRTVLYGESKEVVHSLLPCCGARKTLTLDGARLRFSTAATRPSPLHPPPAARRRAPPSDFSFSAGFLFCDEKECIGVLRMMRVTVLLYENSRFY